MNLPTQKELGAVIVACLLSLIEFGLFAAFLPQALDTMGYAIGLLLLSILWVAVMAIALALARHPISIAVLILTPVIVVIMVSFLSPLAIGAAALLCIFALLAQRSFIREVQNRIYYRTSNVFSGGLRFLTLGLMIALTGLVLPALTRQGALPDRLQVTEQEIAPLVRPVEPIIGKFLPGYRSGMTINELIDQQNQGQLQQLEDLPPGFPSGLDIKTVARDQQRREISSRLGVPLTGSETITAIIAIKLNEYLANLTSYNAVLAVLILVVVVFLTLRALVPFIVWPIIGIIAVFVFLFRYTGLISLTQTQATVEHLEF